MTTFSFTKMHGLGNDFVVIDNCAQQLNLTAKQIQLIADRHFGVGCDQLLLVEKPAPDSNADFKYRIFNADGSEVAQCGNGARCFARFVREQHLSSKGQLLVDTHARQLLLTFEDNGDITVNMGIPLHAPAQIPLIADHESKTYPIIFKEQTWTFGAVSLGNPHAVLQVDDVQLAPVHELGKYLERHPCFPERANIGFMHILNRQHINLRVYERGAGETSACGSGACAAVVIGIELGLLDHHVQVSLPGGLLTISWVGRQYPVMMTGPAVSVFEGQLTL